MDFSKLVQLMERLRREGGCPWDRKQTIETLKPYLIEETYELVDAIESKEPGQIREELGDLLFQVVFLTRICQDNGWFGIDEVIEQVHRKMVRRHPHVFGESSAETAEEVLVNWNKIKAMEKAGKGRKSVTDDIPQKLPALRRAFRLQRKVAMVGFDWTRIEDVLAKVDEELGELRQGIGEQNQDSIEEEIGDLLFSVVNTARFLHIDAENALNKTIAKFIARFKKVEARLTAGGRRIDQFTLEEMDAEWEKIKKERG